MLAHSGIGYSSHARSRRAAIGMAVAALVSFSVLPSLAQDDEEEPYRPGLVASYSGAQATTCERIDTALQFAWQDQRPDLRLARGPFSATWRGRLFSIAPGTYRLYVHAAGHVRIRLEDATLLDEGTDDASWLTAAPIELRYGYHPLEIAYQSPENGAEFGLFWSGPQFQLEPVPDRHLFHEPADALASRFDEGRLLVESLRCAACHTWASAMVPDAGPSLRHLEGNLSRDWLVRWLLGEDASSHDTRAGIPAASNAPLGQTALARRMPRLAIAKDEAEAIADYLFARSEPAARAIPPKFASIPTGPFIDDGDEDGGEGGKKKRKNDNRPHVPNRAIGERLFDTLGCLACHQVGGIGAIGLFGGGDLSNVADKRPEDFFNRWLADPAALNESHRMPVFPLTDAERTDLVAYLTSLVTADPRAATRDVDGGNTVASAARLTFGKSMIDRHRCGVCHALPGTTSPELPSDRRPLAAGSAWERGCLDAPDVAGVRPGYRLSAEQKSAIMEFCGAVVTDTPDRRPAEVRLDGRIVMAVRNCLGCHARGLGVGNADQLADVVAAHEELAPYLPAFSPPSLNGVGDKMSDTGLAEAIALKRTPLRPWLAVRMPRFDLSDRERDALVAYLVESDRIPDDAPREAVPEIAVDDSITLAGSRLVTAGGFGCTSCHQIGTAVPQEVALNARGTDLSRLGSRIRREWFDRWVRNPARIVPRMEMPSITIPVQGVLDNQLAAQLESVWHVLNLPDFNPPQPNPIRIVRGRGIRDSGDWPVVMTDVLEIGEQVFVKPLAVALPNRHTMLYDMEHGRLAAWWLGDAAWQRTRGKSWYWEAGGAQLLATAAGEAELQLVRDGQISAPVVVGQFPVDLDWFEKTPDGVRWSYRLRYENPDRPFSGDRQRASGEESNAKSLQTLVVTETISSVWPEDDDALSNSSGFRRRVEIDGVGQGTFVRCSILPGSRTVLDADHRSATADGPAGDVRVAVLSPDDARFNAAQSGAELLLAGAGPDRPISFDLEYTTQLPIDQFPVESPPVPPPPPARWDILPGWDVVRLPLTNEIMPTGLAWREDGTMVITSLKGRVWLATDADGDGLEEQLTLFGDELAAPYGAASHQGAVDVINKYGLLRLYDADGDGRAERTEVVASGWGHTTDYHDWAVGLAADEVGTYYVALPCQQDDRPLAATTWRGTAVRLIPRTPTRENPRAYAVEPFVAGLRFPMGIARNRDGALFTTDNQGNYNPFNELNHLVDGARYGFINEWEKRPGFDPPFRAPAIDIPHPWARSVNGIAFLYTPEAARRSLGRDAFGPFEGHLIGCEFNNRILVRMTLQAVGDTYQGAIYPFTRLPDDGISTFEGPVVCAVAPTGDVYVGSLHDSGWSGGQNTGSVARLHPGEAIPPGIAEVRAVEGGFTIDFTSPVARELAANRDAYQMRAYRRISTPAYGGPDVDDHSVGIRSVTVSADARQVMLAVDDLAEGFVYEFQLDDLSGTGTFFPAEAHYTLRHLVP